MSHKKNIAYIFWNVVENLNFFHNIRELFENLLCIKGLFGASIKSEINLILAKVLCVHQEQYLYKTFGILEDSVYKISQKLSQFNLLNWFI